jgi:hypothetical protein
MEWKGWLKAREEKGGSKGTPVTINQIKMLTTSCKNYKSLKQCVIEKRRHSRGERAVMMFQCWLESRTKSSDESFSFKKILFQFSHKD